MKRSILIAALLIVVAFAGCASKETHRITEPNFTSLYSKTKESIVIINALYVGRGPNFGTGVVLSSEKRSDGEFETFIMTNRHILYGAYSVLVLGPDKKGFVGEVIGMDRLYDLTLIQIISNQEYMAVTVGNSDSAKIGDWAYAIGHPHKSEFSINLGVVSNFIPRYLHLFIRFGGLIMPGNSGGGVFNTKGELIGIPYGYEVTVKPDGQEIQGSGVAIPINLIKEKLSQLKQGTPPFYETGIRGVPTYDFMTTEVTGRASSHRVERILKGIRVLYTQQDSGAAKAGILANDIVTEVDGVKIEDPWHFKYLINQLQKERIVSLTVIRKAELLKIPVLLEEIK